MKVMHVGQMIGGLDIYIRNSITFSSGELEYVIVHGRDDKSKPVYCKGKEVREIFIPLYREIGLNDLRSIHQLVQIIKEEKPDVIHCHSAKGIVGRIAGFLTHTPTLYTPHAFSFLSSPNRIKRFVFKAIEFVSKCNANLLACSNSEYKIGRHVIRYSKSHAYVWQNSVPEPEFKEKEMKLTTPSSPYIYYIGRPSYQKNPLFTIDVIGEVIKVHPEIKFFLLGVGYYSPDLEEVKKRIYEKRLEDYIQLMEWVSHSDVMAFAQQSLFYISMARYEGLPLSVIEAMSLGKPVIASKVVGNQDCVFDGVNGRLVRLEAKEFAAAICDLIENPEKREQMGEASRRLYEEKFKIDNRISELEAIYKKVGTR